jgi:hypothetical protein
VWSDVLHEGPVPPDDDLADWIRTRAAFLASFDTMAEREVLDSYLVAQAALETAPEHDEVVFWFEHDLYDQLLLIRHLNWWQRSGLDPVRAGLVCIGEYPGIADFHGLGELSPTQLAGLLPGRQTIGAAQLDLGREAWEAFTASDPTAFQAMRDRDTSALPFLSGAVTRMLEEYPATGTGLGRTETQILESLAAAPLAPARLFRASQKREESVFMGDLTFWQRVIALSGGVEPLLRIREGEAAGSPAGETFRTSRGPAVEISLTEAGRAVLSGDADQIELNGIDRWIGGVHLLSDSSPWRWDAAARALVRE